MMMRWNFFVGAIGAAFVLAACADSSSGPALPPTPDGAQAPSELAAPQGQIEQATISPQQRTEFEQLIVRYLDAAQQQLAPDMSTVTAAPANVVAMQPGGEQRWHVELVAGTPYRFIGACDDDCSNINFELIAPGGGVVASDLGPDDFPVASYTPAESGRYIARLMMLECRLAPCFAAVRTLSGAAGAAPETPSEDKP